MKHNIVIINTKFLNEFSKKTDKYTCNIYMYVYSDVVSMREAGVIKTTCHCIKITQQIPKIHTIQNNKLHI